MERASISIIVQEIYDVKFRVKGFIFVDFQTCKKYCSQRITFVYVVLSQIEKMVNFIFRTDSLFSSKSFKIEIESVARLIDVETNMILPESFTQMNGTMVASFLPKNKSISFSEDKVSNASLHRSENCFTNVGNSFRAFCRTEESSALTLSERLSISLG